MHDWYDWVKDIGLPLLTGGGSVVVGVAALRVAARGHELAASASEREERSARFETRQRVAVELLDLVRVRVWDITEPVVTGVSIGRPMIRPGAAAHMNDRTPAEITTAATTFAGSLNDVERLGFDWLLNLLNDILGEDMRDHATTMATLARLLVERWSTDPVPALDRMRDQWPQHDPS